MDAKTSLYVYWLANKSTAVHGTSWIPVDCNRAGRIPPLLLNQPVAIKQNLDVQQRSRCYTKLLFAQKQQVACLFMSTCSCTFNAQTNGSRARARVRAIHGAARASIASKAAAAALYIVTVTLAVVMRILCR